MEFVLGQRWVSQTEPDLGLGVVVGLEGRNVTVRFPAAEEDRAYAQNNSPLARVIYQVGEPIADTQQRSGIVQDLEDVNGLIVYYVTSDDGQNSILPETQVSGLVKLSSPSQRLLSGQFDRDQEYELRVATLHHRHALQQADVSGLLGARTSLLHHQVYIAQEVASRFAPRVLLADEVGLGKTIEAGMILHHQLQTGRASRALIVVPDALLHQWLVEMLRKFNLPFALFDAQRIAAILGGPEAIDEPDEDLFEDSTEAQALDDDIDAINPFETEQLVLCGSSLFVDDPQALGFAELAPWDLVIVDEAHHLFWSEQTVSPQYSAIERLSARADGLLLLTATPEQLGQDSHFARLRLLDPSRFSDLGQFKSQQTQYAALNSIVEALQAQETLTAEQQNLLNEFVGEQVDVQNADLDPLIKQLLDRHGTGRVLFRNTRDAITGFPERKLHQHLLTTDESMGEIGAFGVFPEEALRKYHTNWVKHDPRVTWLENFLKQDRTRKVLVICAQAQTAIDLEEHLHMNVGVRSAAFYEGLTIIERDRAAAYFAEHEGGAQALICSEIGSEGRNFQFAHHLVLFDLPTNPDLLEQRIGRLDRIGQTQDVVIHVPYIKGSAVEVLLHWYAQGLNAFEHSFSAGAKVLSLVGEQLQGVLDNSSRTDEEIERLVSTTAAHANQLREELARGRDRLLERNSCDPESAQALISEIETIEQSDALQRYAEALFDTYGVDYEPHTDDSLVIRPSEQMLSEGFPYLGEEGMTITYRREFALQREDIEFVSWEAPLITGAMEMLIGADLGNSTISTMSLKGVAPGTLLVECFFVPRSSAPKKYQVSRFLPETPVRVLLDGQKRNLTEVIDHAQLNSLCQPIRKSARPAIIKEIRSQLEAMIQEAEKLAQPQLAPLQHEALQKLSDVVGEEATRLRALAEINPSVRKEEIAFFEHQFSEVKSLVEQALLEPQAMRAIITV